ncbi:apolipo protein O-domain-containing protein [Russula aff. rugulosa BPL654]|nr:apolipo protein O-domain-containing protein [Russula aff. rugulosa BPL654]
MTERPQLAPQKLSIYPEPEREIIVVDAPSVLETEIGVARKAVTGVARDVHRRVHGAVSEWIGIEHAVEHRVKALIAPDESLTPALLYVGVASLSGSILARNRSVFSRILLPPTFLLLSFNYFLPKTTHNVSAYAGSLEEKHFPSLAQKHAVAIAHSHMTWERVRAAGISGRDKVQDGFGSAARKVQELTGLKVHEALGRGTTIASEAVEKAEEALQSVKDAAAAEARQPGEKAVEEKGEEGRRKV